ncbi:NACHT domain-containing NTPase [Planktothrix sp. FACHB-1355]|uniref:NACHT domain-containing protein n=1 Tax=Planktothrix sp. FACHB-1355 TaxID=2692854 RepID=UPI003221426A
MQKVRSHHCSKLERKYSKIRLFNLQQVEVDKLYVEVYLLERVTSRFRAEIEDLLNGVDPLRYFDRLGLGARQSDKRAQGLEIARRLDKLMVLGKPGAGKSTFLQHLAVACCRGEFLPGHIPVLIALRDVDASQFDLLRLIHQALRLPEQQQTEQILKQGWVLILLDGLDEVSSQFRKSVRNQIVKFVEDYDQNHIILTCRTQTTEYNLPTPFEYVEVADFSPEQVRIFVENWFTASFTDPKQGTALKEQFLEKLESNRQIADLAVTPILLSLTCSVFSDLQDLPKQRSALYRDGLNLLLKQWDEDREITREVGNGIYRQLTLEQKEKLLSELAFRKFQQLENFVLFEQQEIEGYIAEHLQISSTDSSPVLKAIETQHGLLIERAQRIWSFSHLTFQEYFTACHYLQSRDLPALATHVIEPPWREVFLLATEMLQPTDRLVQLMKQQIDRALVESAKLQEFLTWVEQKSTSVQAPYKPAAIRAFYFAIVLAHGFDIERTLSDALALALDRDRNRDYTLALALDRNLTQECALFARERSHTYALALGYSLNHPRNRSLDIKLAQTLVRTLNKPELDRNLQMLGNQLPHISEDNWENFQQWWQINGQAWIKQLRAVIIDYCNIGHDWQFSNEQHQLLRHYYDANKLLVDCLNNSCTVNNEVRMEIEETLLLPIAEIEKLGSCA